jgi:hypothetical protein
MTNSTQYVPNDPLKDYPEILNMFTEEFKQVLLNTYKHYPEHLDKLMDFIKELKKTGQYPDNDVDALRKHIYRLHKYANILCNAMRMSSIKHDLLNDVIV